MDSSALNKLLSTLTRPSLRIIKEIGDQINNALAQSVTSFYPNHPMQQSMCYLASQIDRVLYESNDSSIVMAYLFLIDYLLFASEEGAYHWFAGNYQRPHLQFLVEVATSKSSLDASQKTSVNKLAKKWSTKEIKMRPVSQPTESKMDLSLLSKQLQFIAEYLPRKEFVEWNCSTDADTQKPSCQICMQEIPITWHQGHETWHCDKSVMVGSQIRHRSCDNIVNPRLKDAMQLE